MQALIRQAKIIDKGSAFHNKTVDILIENGIIKEIAANIKAKVKTIVEGEGLHISAGWVDIMADYAEPGYEHKETITTGLAVAATGGYTDVLLAPNTNPAISTKSIVEFVLQKARGNVTNLHPMGSVSRDIEGTNLAEMLDMYHNGAKAFTDGWKPIQNANLMLKALEYIKAFNGNLVQIPADAALSAGGLMHEGELSTSLGMAGIPVLAETLMVHRDIELLRYTNSRLHISGISSAESVELVRKAKKDGLDITCSVTPYHLVLTDEALSSYSSMYKVTPPLRSEADRKALIAGLKDGTIDCIASHHRPQDWDAKEREFEYAADGMNLQEFTFSIIWNAIGKKVGLERFIDAMTVRPREIFNLQTTSLAEGSPAGLTIFTIDNTRILEVESIKSKSANNPFIGKEISGSIIGILNNGIIHLNS